jgi:ADP-heptose:LPS heptosyltransferase
MTRILLFKIGAIGDTLMTTPLLRQLRRNYPKAKIDYLIGNVASQVLVGNKNLDNIIKFDEKIFFKKQIIKYYSLIQKIRKRKYDIIFVLDKHRIFNLTAKLFGIPERIGFDRLGKEGTFLTKKTYYGNDKHEIYYYLDLLTKLTEKVDYSDNLPSLYISKKAYNKAESIWKKYSLNHKIIAIAPGGGANPGENKKLANRKIY